MGTLLMFGLGMTEILIILLLVLLLFGGRRIPELLRGLGRGIRDFKEEMKDGDGKSAENKETKGE